MIGFRAKEGVFDGEEEAAAFPELFKRQAVERVETSGLSVSQVAVELGLHETVLRCRAHLFDLPVGTKAERKRATRFRNDILHLGFEMVQFSVYLRHAWSREKAESFARQVGDCVVFRGRSRPAKPEEKPRQLALF